MKKKSILAPGVTSRPLGLDKLQAMIAEEEAQKNDNEYYRDGIFYGDEQQEKTNELSTNLRNRIKLAGYDDPEDPGFHPAVEHAELDLDTDDVQTLEPFHKYTSEKSGKEFNIFPFKYEMIAGKDWCVIFNGKRRSGKTKAIESLCGNYLRQWFPRIIVFTKTKFSREYSRYVPDEWIIQGLDSAKLEAVFELQRRYKDAKAKGSFQDVNISLLVILDDCLADNLKYNDLVEEIFYNGRHLDIFFIVATQDIKGLKPAVTGNADMSFFFRFRSERDETAIREKHADGLRDNHDLESLCDGVFEHKWHFVAFDQSQPHRPAEYSVYGGRFPEPEKFVMGCKGWWKNCRRQLEALGFGYLWDLDSWNIDGEEFWDEKAGL